MKSKKAMFGVVFALAVALILSFALFVPTAGAADGNFDPTFGGDGIVATDFATTIDELYDIAIQPNGKIVAVGGILATGVDYAFSIARYNSDGSLDTSFSLDGLETTQLSVGADAALAVAVQPDGKIVAAGYCASGANAVSALVRYNADGSLDTTFGDAAGKVCGAWTTSLSDVAIQPDGKIVASGYAVDLPNSFAVYRFNSNGTPDTSFGDQGRAPADFFGGVNAANAVALQPDGKIVASGSAQHSGTDHDFAIARYNLNGSLDSSFGGTGEVTIDYEDGEDVAYSLALNSDGEVYIAGKFRSSTRGFDFGLVRLNSNGTPDVSFSDDGLVDAPFGAGTNAEGAFDLAVQPADGKVVLAGFMNDSQDSKFALARVNPDGLLDVSFGQDGRLAHDIFDGDSLAFTIAIQSDGKFIAAGFGYSNAHPANDYEFSLVRYLSPTSCAISFTDVPQGSTFYDFITCIYCEGVIGGYETGCETGSPCFRPNSNLTRGQLAKIVSNASGFSENFVTSTFEDVPAGSTFHLFIERLASRSIIGGYACGGPGEPCGNTNKPYFRPNANVTRGQTAKIVYIAANIPPPPPNQQLFEDVPTTHTFWEFIGGLNLAGIINGYACGGPGEPCGTNNKPYFRPSANVTRGQSSKIISLTYFRRCSEQAALAK